MTALTEWTGTPMTTGSTSRSSASGSSARSLLLTTITGLAPLSQADVRYRSSRRGLRSNPNAVTTKTVSTLAAITWVTVLVPASFRVNDVRRGSTASIMAFFSPGTGRTATQSPTAGSSSSESLPEGRPPMGPSSVNSSHGP